MAITIAQNPFLHSPAYNPLDYVVTSNNTAQDNFRYVCDIYITNVTPSFFRVFADKDPNYNSGHFDIHRIVENFVSGDIVLADTAFNINPNAYRKYTCKFGEAYGVSSAVTVYPNLTVDTSRYAWNACLDFVEFKNLTANKYLMEEATGVGKFLTNRPEPNNISFDLNESAFTYIMGDDNNNSNNLMRIITYDSTGAILQTVYITNSYTSPASVTNHKFLRFASGVKQINAVPASLISGGSQPIITSSVAKYAIAILNPALNRTSETRTYKIKNVCSKDTAVRLHFLNKYGGFDSFTFDIHSAQSAAIKRSEYKRMAGGFATANSWKYDKTDSLDINFDTNIKDTVHLISDWINEDISTWLEELVTSPWIYLEDATDGLISVSIVNSQYNRKKNAFDKIFNLELDIQYSYNRYRQRL